MVLESRGYVVINIWWLPLRQGVRCGGVVGEAFEVLRGESDRLEAGDLYRECSGARV
jgi:hypothetical protein